MDLREIPAGAFQRHPWEVARVRFFTEVIQRYGLASTAVSVQDVGAGDGYFSASLLPALPPHSHIVFFDPFYEDAFLQQRPLGPLTFTRDRPREPCDLLLLLDVIEHVPDDLAVLKEVVTHQLRPGGYALLSVPAFMGLITQHDVTLGHYRRYAASELRRVLQRVPLEIVAAGGLFHSLLPWRVVEKVRERLAGRNTVPDLAQTAHGTDLSTWTAGPFVTRAVMAVLRLDNALSHRAATLKVSLPGLSTWALARKAF